VILLAGRVDRIAHLVIGGRQHVHVGAQREARIVVAQVLAERLMSTPACSSELAK
jgi:hypothetical protein